MVPGDIVRKKRGSWQNGKIGLVVEIIKNSAGHTIVRVLSGGVITVWVQKYVEVVNG